MAENKNIIGSANVICTTPIVEMPKTCDTCAVAPSTTIEDLNRSLLGKMIRFRCVIGGKGYFLMMVPFSRCSNLFVQPGTTGTTSGNIGMAQRQDCMTNVIVLIDETAALAGNASYLQQIADKQTVCNFQQNLQCSRNPASVGVEAGAVCPSTFQQCVQTSQYPIDFTVTQSQLLGSSIPSYYIRGVSMPLGLNDSNNAFYYVNYKVPNLASGTGLVCGDSTSTSDSNIQAELITTKAPFVGGVIGSNDSLLRTRIRFNVPIVPFIMDSNGKAMTVSMYVGYCGNNMCTIDGVSYYRACLYDDGLNANVLEFQPST